jgi:hypothetical protein
MHRLIGTPAQVGQLVRRGVRGEFSVDDRL